MQFRFDTRSQGVVDGLVELDEDSEREGGAEHLQLHQLVQTLLQGVACRGEVGENV